MTVSAPPVRRRLVGRALRRYREGRGYTLNDVARMLECDASKLSRIELGQRGIRDKELRELCVGFRQEVSLNRERETIGRTLTFFKSTNNIVVDGNQQVRTQTKGGNGKCTS